MHDAGTRRPELLRIVDDLRGNVVAAVVYGPVLGGHAVLRVNKRMLAGEDFDRVLSWARRELASEMPGSWLLADELADLA